MQKKKKKIEAHTTQKKKEKRLDSVESDALSHSPLPQITNRKKKQTSVHAKLSVQA